MMKKFWGFSLLLILVFASGLQAIERPAYEPGIIIVKTKPSQSQGFKIMSSNSIQTFNTKLGALSTKTLPTPTKSKNLTISQAQGTTYLVQFNATADITTLIQSYLKESWVDWAQPNYYVYSTEMPTDPDFSKQDYLSQTGLYYILDIPTTGDILVAILDSGIDDTHLDIKDAIFHNSKELLNGIDDDQNGVIDDTDGYNFAGYSTGQDNRYPTDEFGHGTHLAGLIAAQANNQIGIAGVNPKAKLLNVRFLDRLGRGTQVDSAQAIYYAVDMGAKILNCSWGYNKYNTILKNAIDDAISKGVIVVAAAGNRATNEYEYPAAFENVIGVGSINLDQSLSSFSNYGAYVQYVEPGNSIYSTALKQAYCYKSGTSQSTAILSGIISKIWAYHPELSGSQILRILKNSSNEIQITKNDQTYLFRTLSIPQLFSVLNLPTTNLDIRSMAEQFQQNELQKQQELEERLLYSASVNLSVPDLLNFPNPVGSTGTTFGFTLENSAGSTALAIDEPHITIQIYDLKGYRVKKIESTGTLGYNTLFWNGDSDQGNSLSNGTYLYIFECKTSTQRILKRGKLSILK